MILTNVGLNPIPAWCIVVYDAKEMRFRIVIRKDLALRKPDGEERILARIRKSLDIKDEVPGTACFEKYFGFGESLVCIQEDAQKLTYAATIPQIVFSLGKCAECKGKGKDGDGCMCHPCAGCGVVTEHRWEEANKLVGSLSLLFAMVMDTPPEKGNTHFNQPMTIMMDPEPGCMHVGGEMSAEFVSWVGDRLSLNQEVQEMIQTALCNLYVHMMCAQVRRLKAENKDCIRLNVQENGWIALEMGAGGARLAPTCHRNSCADGNQYFGDDCTNVHLLLLLLAGLGMLQKQYLAQMGIRAL